MSTCFSFFPLLRFVICKNVCYILGVWGGGGLYSITSNHSIISWQPRWLLHFCAYRYSLSSRPCIMLLERNQISYNAFLLTHKLRCYILLVHLLLNTSNKISPNGRKHLEGQVFEKQLTSKQNITLYLIDHEADHITNKIIINTI